mgnify:CR=1 FL=1
MSHPDSARRAELIKKYRIHDKDSGSPEVQVALLTRRLEVLAQHFKAHAKDLHSQRGMSKLISRRKRLLAYLKRENIERYKNLIAALGLRK